MSTFSDKWAAIYGALRYGFSIYYAAKIEGVPYLFIEKDPSGSISETGHTVDASLIVDESAKVGSRIDEATGIGRAFDLTFGLERSAAVVSLLKKPSNITRLTSDLTHSETGSIRVDSTAGFASSGAVYVGNERIEYTGTTATQFQTLTRGTPGSSWKGQAFSTASQIATWVTDSPMFWRGRSVILYAIPVDPFGRVVSSSLSDGIQIWRGHINGEPTPYPGGWSFSCRPLDRRLDDHVTASFSGSVVLKTDPDPKVKINPDLTISIITGSAYGYSGAWPTDANAVNTGSWQPFDGLDADTFYPISYLEKQVQLSWMSNVVVGYTTYWPATTPKFITGGPWQGADKTVKITPSGDAPAWKHWQTRQLFVKAKAEATGAITKIQYAYIGNIQEGDPIAIGFSPEDFTGNPEAAQGGYWSLGVGSDGWMYLEPLTDTDYHWIPLPLMFILGNQLGSMSITLDDEEPASVPDAGWIVLEGNDKTIPVKYSAKTVEGSKITVTTDGYNGDISEIMAALGDGDSPEISCKFCFLDSGQVVDTMRRMLYSSGRGDNDDGTFDTLPAGSGYDLDAIDDNFAIELDGGWSDLSADFLLDEGVSFAAIYGPMLALSQRAIVTRNAGAGVRLSCVATSVAETAAYSFTLKDEHILAGSQSVKASQEPDTPNRVDLELVRHGAPMGRVVINDIVSQRADGLRVFGARIDGFNRDEIAPAALGWARSLFAARGGRLVYEIPVAPWVSCQVGDAIRIESDHFNFWDRSTGLRGYTGTARVLGRQDDLKRQRSSLFVAISGAFQTMTLCPSAKLTANDDTTNPTSITVEGKYHALMTAYLAAEPSGFRLLVYAPGTDQTGDYVTISAVSGSPSTSTTLAVSAYSLSAPLSNGTTHLTIPFTADDSSVQAYHMHTDTEGAAWQ